MEIDKIDIKSLLNSLKIEENREKIFKAGQASGKSGSFFFFSNDKKYIIKTMIESEKNKLLKMLPSYIKYIQSN